MGEVAKPTPGPWRPFIRNGVIAVMRGKGPKNEVVHWSGFDGSHFPEDAIANAFLIAAAPEMLEALRPFARWADDPIAKPTYDDCARARAAIAKATGAAS